MVTPPALLRLAAPAIPGLRAWRAPGQDDIPDRQTGFDVSAIGRDLGWTPGFGLTGGLQAYRPAILAGEAAP